MRKIDTKTIVCFFGTAIPTCIGAIYTSSKIIDLLNLTDSILAFKLILSLPLIFGFNLISYRIFLKWFPLSTGYYEENSREQTTYNFYVLYYLLFFNSILPSLLVPVPLMRMIYLWLGAKLGDNTYSAGVILDPPLVQVGANTILGYDCVICPHAVENNRLYFGEIKIGNNVTIGMRSIVMANVIIEDECIVAAGSTVIKGSHLKKGEVWAGTPAKKMKNGPPQLEINTPDSIQYNSNLNSGEL